MWKEFRERVKVPAKNYLLQNIIVQILNLQTTKKKKKKKKKKKAYQNNHLYLIRHN